MILSELIYVAMAPLIVAAAIAFLCQRMRLPPRVAWGAGVGLGYVAGQLGLASRAGVARIITSLVRPHEAVDWLPHAVLLALGVTILATYAPRAWHRWIVVLTATLSIGLPLRLLAGSAYVTRWSALEKLSYLALLSATFGLTWLLLAAARDDEHPRLRPVLMIVVAAAAAVVVALSGVLVYGELCGVVAAALSGTGLVRALGATGFASVRLPLSLTESLAKPAAHVRGVNAAAGVLTFSLGSLIVLSSFYAKLTPANAALLFLSLMIAGGRLPGFLSSWPSWQQVAIRAGVCLLPLTIALARAVAAAQASMSASPYGM